ncbi:hypothetical protein N431DRAFT_483554 [Stipitochalara longipes BDJ]|nr:hypothetical protein N431DRAFT_483554 [Stipitochalara longipes BDJ]
MAEKNGGSGSASFALQQLPKGRGVEDDLKEEMERVDRPQLKRRSRNEGGMERLGVDVERRKKLKRRSQRFVAVGELLPDRESFRLAGQPCACSFSVPARCSLASPPLFRVNASTRLPRLHFTTKSRDKTSIEDILLQSLQDYHRSLRNTIFFNLFVATTTLET